MDSFVFSFFLVKTTFHFSCNFCFFFEKKGRKEKKDDGDKVYEKIKTNEKKKN